MEGKLKKKKEECSHLGHLVGMLAMEWTTEEAHKLGACIGVSKTHEQIP